MSHDEQHWKDVFVSVNGRRIHYLQAGQGTPLLLLHTGGGSAYEFEHVIPALAAHHTVIAWDMPGHGDSDPILSHHRIEDYRVALAGFIDALGFDRVVLAGASIGGYIGMDYARTAPERLDRAVIIEAPLRSPEWYRQNWLMFEAMCAIPETPYEQLAGRFRALTPELFRRWNMDRYKAGSWTIVDLAWAAREFDAAGAFGAMRVPVTIMLGAKGPTVGERERLVSLQPHAKVHVLSESGHFPMIDDPDGFVRVTLD